MNTSKNRRPVIVGLFILIGLSILVTTIFTMGGQKKTFVKSFKMHAIFKDVGGLLKGGNVWFSGVKVGTVKGILFHGLSEVEIIMDIEMDVQPHIRQDAMARLGTDGLIGNKIVVVYGGSATSPAIQDEGFLLVENALTTDDMMATLQANNANLLDITNNFKHISRNLDSGNGSLPTLLNSPELANKLNQAVENLDGTITDFRKVSRSTNTVFSNLINFSGNLNKPGTSIHDLITDTTIYKGIKNALGRLDNSVQNLDLFTNNLKNEGKKLSSKNNVVGLLLNDSSTAASLRTTIENMESSSKKLDDDLEALQHNFFLKGFFKKKKAKD